MAERRMLSKKASEDRRLAQLSDRSALLYVLSIPHLDVEGRMNGLPALVRGTVVPEFAHARPNDWTDQHVADYILEWTSTLDDLGAIDPLVFWYAAHGHSVCAFRGFSKNQTLRRDREAPSRLPAPPPELLQQPAMAPATLPPTANSRRPPGPEVEVEVEVQGSLHAVVVQDPARARDGEKPLQVTQVLEERLAERGRALSGGFSERPAATHLDLTDMRVLSGQLRGHDEKTPLTLSRYLRKGCGEREFALAAESLDRRRRVQPRLDSEVRYFVSELARLLREREENVA